VTKRVAIYCADLLPISQTFVRDQACFLGDWQPVLVGRREVEPSLQTPGIPRAIVPEAQGRIAGALRYWTGRPDARMVQKLKALQVDLVHAHFGPNATEIWPSVKAAGLPMVVTLHGYDVNIERAWWEAGHGGLQARAYPRRLLRMARDPAVRFIAVSQAIKRRAIAYGIPEEKVSAAYIGVDTQRFRPGGVPLERRRKRTLFVGRMVEKKAPLLMVRIFAELRNTVPDAELVMIGDGPLLAAARQLAQDMAVPIAFPGACTSEEVLAHMHEARVLCLPSTMAPNGDAEGFGQVLLEAQACGVPVVTSARGGASEGLVGGETGFACEEGSIGEFVAALRRMLTDDAASARASSAASRFASSVFDVRNCSKQLELEYDRMRAGALLDGDSPGHSATHRPA
jgi:glycosyltransferase involved in cell wall biosynthesis